MFNWIKENVNFNPYKKETMWGKFCIPIFIIGLIVEKCYPLFIVYVIILFFLSLIDFNDKKISKWYNITGFTLMFIAMIHALIYSLINNL